MDRASLTVGPAMDMPIMHDCDRYELVKDIGSGNFGVARLMRDRQSGELVAVKYIERGEKMNMPALYTRIFPSSGLFSKDMRNLGFFLQLLKLKLCNQLVSWEV